MVELVERAFDDFEVADGVDRGAGAEADFLVVVRVHVVIHDDDCLGEHRLAEAPNAVHDLACVAREGFLERDDHEVVERAPWGEIDIDDFGELFAHDGEGELEDGLDDELLPGIDNCREHIANSQIHPWLFKLLPVGPARCGI